MVRTAVLACTIVMTLGTPAVAQITPEPAPVSDRQFQTSPVNCVAVFELMSRDLPYHLREPGMGFAWRVWHLEASRQEDSLEHDIATRINARISEFHAKYDQDPYGLLDAAETCAKLAMANSSNRS